MRNQTDYENKWQQEWESNEIFRSSISSKPKFYLVFAYPTVSGTLHVGHNLSYTIPDVIARYKRLRGFNVFFPLGFHATGVDCSKIYEECKNNPVKGANKYGLEKNATGGFTSPLDVDKYLETRMIAAFKRMGISIDESTATSTIDPHYNKFIQWQYRRLNGLGYLKQGDYVLPYCNDCQQVISIDAAQAEVAEGAEAEVKEYEILKFKDDNGIVFPIATLRPETVFGVTNLWVHPDAEYTEANIDNEIWIVSDNAIEKLENLGKRIEIKRTFMGSELSGKEVINPATGNKIVIIPANFVDVSEATGVVMSVPAHDPFDYKYFKEITDTPDDKIPLVIDMPMKGIPSAVVLEKHKGDAEAAVKELYKLEYRGMVLKDIPIIGGLPTAKAKDVVIQHLAQKNLTDKIYEFTVKRVEDRYGHRVVIKKLGGQWFVDYSNQKWKELAKECVEQMNFYPPEYKKELPSIIDWLHERPLIRKRGLGTEFPFANGWIIEALSDSTIYMAFYVVAKAVNTGKLKVDEIDDSFFDYVLLGQDEKKEHLKCNKQVAETIRKEFEYFYPLDMNFGGKEHKSVHFPFFIFHHSAIFDRRFWPKGVFVNWHLIVEGEKMSKSKGNVIFWDDAISKYGADAIRFYVTHGTNQWNDFDWKNAEMERYVTHLEGIKTMLDNALDHKDNTLTLNQWIEAMFNKRLKDIEVELDKYEIRNAASLTFFEIRNDLQWLKSRGGTPSKSLLGKWMKVLSIFIPHTAEEYWYKLGNKTLISTESWPSAEVFDENSIKLEQEVKTLVDDLNNLMKIVKEKKTKLFIYSLPNEVQYLKDASEFIKQRFVFDSVTIVSVADKDKYDPIKKASKAKPGKPAIYLE